MSALQGLGAAQSAGGSDRRKRRVAFGTLGCKLNQYETDSLATQFQAAGYDVVPFESDADAYVINTCTVTNKSDRKSRNVINRAAGRAGADGEASAGGNHPVVVVTGCFVDSNRSYLDSRDDVTYVVDNHRKSKIFHIVDAHFRGEILLPESLTEGIFDYPPADHGFHTRSMVKIQDGCDNFCTFCIIPFVRGRAASRPLPDILDNARSLINSGSREIVLTGVNMGRYSSEGCDFTGVVAAILDLPGSFRLRISSLEPEGIGERFVELLGHPKMCPHLHLCVQSGSDRILLQMRRTYSLAAYRSIVCRIRERYPLFNITTDIIVGFPGETAEEFAESCRLSLEVGFAHIHTFKYSRREGTRAERMNGQVPEPIKNERSEVIRGISEANKRAYRSSLIGRVERVLIERVERLPAGGSGRSGEALHHRATVSGFGEHYVPVTAEIDVENQSLANSFIDIEITGIAEGEDPVLSGEVVDSVEPIGDNDPAEPLGLSAGRTSP